MHRESRKGILYNHKVVTHLHDSRVKMTSRTVSGWSLVKNIFRDCQISTLALCAGEEPWRGTSTGCSSMTSVQRNCPCLLGLTCHDRLGATHNSHVLKGILTLNEQEGDPTYRRRGKQWHLYLVLRYLPPKASLFTLKQCNSMSPSPGAEIIARFRYKALCSTLWKAGKKNKSSLLSWHKAHIKILKSNLNTRH